MLPVAHSALRSFIYLAFTFVAVFCSRGQTLPEVKVAITDNHIRLAWPPVRGTIAIQELPLHTQADLPREAREVWSGDGETGQAEVVRFDGKRDRLFARY